MAWIATGWIEIETGPGAQVKVDARLSAAEKTLVKQQFYASKSGGTYYIDEDTCLGSNCLYVAFVVDATGWQDGVKEEIILINDISVANASCILPEVVLVPDCANNKDQAALIAEVIRECFEGDPTTAMACGDILFIQASFFLKSTYPEKALKPLTGSKPCVVAARELGSCKYTESDIDYSNIFYNGLLNEYPVVMGNCVACNSCIDACPYLAIKNRYNKAAQSLHALSAEFAHHYIKNSRAVLGSNL